MVAMHTSDARLAQAWQLLETLHDPEIPVLTLRDLGILRDVRTGDDGHLEVVITPTYSGCPAIEQIEDDIRAQLAAAGIVARVITQLSPAWTTDWMSAEGRDKLRRYGITPPQRAATELATVQFFTRAPQPEIVPCPQCGSVHTVESARFGSTACKALYKCLDCREPFDYFKPY